MYAVENTKHIRKRKIGVAGDHSKMLNDLREKHNTPKRKVAVNEDHDTVLRNSEYLKETYHGKRNNDVDPQSRRIGANVHQYDHYYMLLKLHNNSTSEKMQNDIAEAAYDLEAKIICKDRRDACQW